MEKSHLIALLGALSCTVVCAQLASDQPVAARPSGATAPASEAAPLASSQPAPVGTAAVGATAGQATTLASSQPATSPNRGDKRAVTATTQSAPANMITGQASRVSADTPSLATTKKQ